MQTFYSASEVVTECGITLRQLYYWEKIGLLSPRYENFGKRQFRRYVEDDLGVLRRTKDLLDQGFTLLAVREHIKIDFPREQKKRKQEGEIFNKNWINNNGVIA